MSRSHWTFITNHGAVLLRISENREITIRQLANMLGITERTVHTIINDLEEEGYIKRSKKGKYNIYEVDYTRSLRRPEARHVMVGDLLQVLSPKQSGSEEQS